jgi:hypothetical protein
LHAGLRCVDLDNVHLQNKASAILLAPPGGENYRRYFIET